MISAAAAVPFHLFKTKKRKQKASGGVMGDRRKHKYIFHSLNSTWNGNTHRREGIFMGYNICKIISEDICAGN